MTRPAMILRGYGKLEPLRQGAVDRFCGLYAIINALTLAAHPIRPLQPRHHQTLFDHGVRFLARKGRLETSSLEGMNERLWISLRDAMLSEQELARALRPVPIMLFPSGRPKELDHALAAITGSIDSGYPVLLALWGAYDHWTVVAGYTPSNLLLFDSWGFRRISISSIALRHPHCQARHKLTWRSSTAIALEA